MSLTEVIKSFVQGEVPAEKLYDEVVSTGSAESLFDGFIAKPYTNDGSLFLYLISQNYSNPETTINLQDALASFLDWKGITYVKDKTALKIYRDILKPSPSWASFPSFYIASLQKDIATTGNSNYQATLKAKIKEDFVYLNKPPKWLQDSEWLFFEKTLMIFVGQLDLGNLNHDISQVYVFANRNKGEIFTTVQTM